MHIDIYIAMQWLNISQTIFSLTTSWRFPSLHCIASIYHYTIHTFITTIPLAWSCCLFIFTVCSYQQLNFFIFTVDLSSFHLFANIYSILGNAVHKSWNKVYWFVTHKSNYCFSLLIISLSAIVHFCDWFKCYCSCNWVIRDNA